jgi:hypothetical protein
MPCCLGNLGIESHIFRQLMLLVESDEVFLNLICIRVEPRPFWIGLEGIRVRMSLRG